MAVRVDAVVGVVGACVNVGVFGDVVGVVCLDLVVVMVVDDDIDVVVYVGCCCCLLLLFLHCCC